MVEDPHYVAGISIGVDPLFLEGSDERIPFKKTLRLSQGRHKIRVSARNLLGKVTTRQLIIHVDREGPLISLSAIERPDAALTSEMTISGSVYDEGRVRELWLNGRPIKIQPGVEAFFSEKIPAGTGMLELIARDSLGNQTVADIPLPPVLSRRVTPMLAGIEEIAAFYYLRRFSAPRTPDPLISA